MIHFVEGWSRYVNVDDALRWFFRIGKPELKDGGALMGGMFATMMNARVSPRSRVHIGFWHECRKRPPSVTNSSFIHLPYGGDLNTSNQIGLGMNPDGTVSVFYGKNFSGLGGLTLGNGSTVLDVGSRHWIELDVVLSLTNTGSVELRIDGNPELSLTGIRTSAMTKALVDRVTICGGANVSTHWFGGLFVSDGDEGWLGPQDMHEVSVALDPGVMAAFPSIEAMRPV
jgi:hypothetical protein